jgi:FlaG/FlaF family flagellin (archaellin)
MIQISRARAIVGSIAAVLILGVNNIQAAPITYEYTGEFTNLSRAPFDQEYAVSLTFDNGGTTIENQTFGLVDFLSATVKSGSYDVTVWAGDDAIDWITDFRSDALGRLGIGYFNVWFTNGDRWHFDHVFKDEGFRASGGFAGYFASHLSNPGRLAAVPEPASLAMFGLVAVGVAVRRWSARAAPGRPRRGVTQPASRSSIERLSAAS